MAPTAYPELNAVLQELVGGIQAVLGKGFIAACPQGSFVSSDFDHQVVREKGIPLAGQSPIMLVDPISVEILRQEIRQTISEWSREILTRSDPFNNRFYQTFIVLNYCRMLHDLHTGFPGSKRAGA